ncbi:hypothetical protein PBI_DEWDROP_99 [Microbacterium phage Dewdrop]|nr:hypothetical protein PBI_LEAF_99 [Microbacterium phage Leaf]QGZ17467.1 hypothetical protein PBI_DEWDROP_99 [Microbacterium phage Dewdrop]
MGRTDMAMTLDGTATTIKRRDKATKIRCAECGEPIRMKKERVVQDGLSYHLLCAGFAHIERVASCPDCFTVAPCLCVGS